MFKDRPSYTNIQVSGCLGGFDVMNKFFPLILFCSIVFATCADSIVIPPFVDELPVEQECSYGQRRMCYTGPPLTKNVGVCKGGYQICKQGVWGKCQGEQQATPESCTDQVDNNCNGIVNEGCCKQWSLHKVLKVPRGVSQVAFGPSGNVLIAAATGFAIWEMSKDFSFSLVGNYSGLEVFIPGGKISFSMDGKLLLLWHNIKEHSEMCLWDWKRKKVISTVRLRTPLRSPTASALSPAGTRIALFNERQTLILDANTGETLQKLPGSRVFEDLAFSPNGSMLALSSFFEDDSVPTSWAVHVWDLVKRKRLYNLTGYKDLVGALLFHPSGQYLVGMSTSELKLWRLESKKLIYTVQRTQLSQPQLAMNKDGTIIASTSDNGEIYLWDVATGQSLQVIQSSLKILTSGVSFHPNGKFLAFVHNMRPEVRIWRCTK